MYKPRNQSRLSQLNSFCINVDHRRYRNYSVHCRLNLRLTTPTRLRYALQRIHAKNQAFTLRIASVLQKKRELLLRSAPRHARNLPYPDFIKPARLEHLFEHRNDLGVRLGSIRTCAPASELPVEYLTDPRLNIGPLPAFRFFRRECHTLIHQTISPLPA